MAQSLKQMLEATNATSHTIQGAAAYPLCLPCFRQFPYEIRSSVNPKPLAAAITRVRENGCAQLLCDNEANMSTSKERKQICDLFRELLNTVQLPGEKILFEVKISKKTDLVVVTLFKETA